MIGLKNELQRIKDRFIFVILIYLNIEEMKVFYFGQDHLSCRIANRICSGILPTQLSEAVHQKINSNRNIVEAILSNDKVVYGINTGFGPLCTEKISLEDTETLQYNILKSHSVGVGDPIPNRIAKLMMILKVQSLAQGFSGISIDTLERILWHINQDIIPIVPSKGSVGASGDLAPLSHLFLPLIGLGKVYYKGVVKPAAEVLAMEGLKPIALNAKEGLALINGTQFIAAYAVETVTRLHRLLNMADCIGAMMLDGLAGSLKPFYKELHELRPFPGNQYVAERIFTFVKDSTILSSHMNCNRVQDPYSLRCMPQVHGASRAAWAHLKELLEIELNAVTDNPVIINEDLTISGGNFHGQPLAMALDYACIAASELGNISDRRVYLSLMGSTEKVPKLLMKDTGLNSSFMMLQYTTAALASENKGLCFPASADSIPTSLGQEDHVSMGSISGRKAVQVIDNVETILAIESICAAQALDFQRPLQSGKVIEDMHQFIRSVIPFAAKDRVFHHDISHAENYIKNGDLNELIEGSMSTNKVSFTEQYYRTFEVF